MTYHGFAAVLAVLCVGSTLDAQVGHNPQTSPYRDLVESHEITLFSGYYLARHDPAGVVPQRGPMAGALYQWRPSGPANLNFSVARVSSERDVLDPERNSTCTPTVANCKSIGTFRWPLYLFDAGFAMSLTGARSFYRLVPELKLGLGLASDFHTEPDVGDFAFGTRFAFTWGAGIRWLPGGRYQVRADLLNHLYSVKYPDTYFQLAPDNSTILNATKSRSTWLNNPGFTIGLSYLFSR
ncbi:MAG TPA: hypothetical protein VFT29_09935 [Gemmatimonadaceae bacterium]|nr:hypothetical protein [Gemmatimonadaceae bacterium]